MTDLDNEDVDSLKEDAELVLPLNNSNKMFCYLLKRENYNQQPICSLLKQQGDVMEFDQYKTRTTLSF